MIICSQIMTMMTKMMTKMTNKKYVKIKIEFKMFIHDINICGGENEIMERHGPLSARLLSARLLCIKVEEHLR